MGKKGKKGKKVNWTTFLTEDPPRSDPLPVSGDAVLAARALKLGGTVRLDDTGRAVIVLPNGTIFSKDPVEEDESEINSDSSVEESEEPSDESVDESEEPSDESACVPMRGVLNPFDRRLKPDLRMDWDTGVVTKV